MESGPDVTLKHKHPLWVRWTHWLNFPLLALMLFSGVQIYWAHDVYTPFIPRSVYAWLGLNNSLGDGMALHFAALWLFIPNGIAYVVYLAASGAWREMLPGRATFREAWQVTLHDLGLRRQVPPQGKFNAAQRIAYTGVLGLGLVATASGLAIYKPVQLPWLQACFGGYEGARLVHFLAAAGFVAFLFVHVAQVIRAGWNTFQAMVTGWEVEDERKKD
jgi:thiosulfate reductase cytochrome b subunit